MAVSAQSSFRLPVSIELRGIDLMHRIKHRWIYLIYSFIEDGSRNSIGLERISGKIAEDPPQTVVGAYIREDRGGSSPNRGGRSIKEEAY